MTNDARRLKHVAVSPEWIVELFKDGNEIRIDVTDGLPADAEFRRIEYNFDRDMYWVIVWSSEFDALEEGEEIPGTVVEFTEICDGLTSVAVEDDD